MKLKDRIVVVTGAGSGIGRACAIEAANEGAIVIGADINLQGADETVKRILTHLNAPVHAMNIAIVDDFEINQE